MTLNRYCSILKQYLDSVVSVERSILLCYLSTLCYSHTRERQCLKTAARPKPLQPWTCDLIAFEMDASELHQSYFVVSGWQWNGNMMELVCYHSWMGSSLPLHTKHFCDNRLLLETEISLTNSYRWLQEADLTAKSQRPAAILAISNKSSILKSSHLSVCLYKLNKNYFQIANLSESDAVCWC